MSRKLLTKFLTRKTFNHISSVKFNTSNIKLKNEEIARPVVPEPVPGLHQAAILKSFGEPLVIENVEPVKLSNNNEVNYFSIFYFLIFILLQK